MPESKGHKTESDVEPEARESRPRAADGKEGGTYVGAAGLDDAIDAGETGGEARRHRGWRPARLAHDDRVRLLLIADTHIPRRARDLPARVWEEVADADVVVHAGDWVAPELLDELEARSARLVACWGNNDGPAVRVRLPERADATLDGLRLTVVHETGATAGREARMSRLYPDRDVLVFGHSHIPWDTRTKTGLRLLNPGSPTDRRRQPFCSYMTASVDDGELTDVVLHFLEK
jgi:putative phosphoesterase